MTGAEVGARWLPLPGRLQVVRGGRHVEIEGIGGVPVWREPRRDALRHAGCERPLAQVYGSSILAGVSLPEGEVFSERLQDLGCVQNLAAPAYTGETALALAGRELPRARPAAVVWEVWGTGGDGYVTVGDAAYNLHGADPPRGLLRVAVAGSRAVEYAWLATLEVPRVRRPDPVRRYVEEIVPAFLALAREAGAAPLFVFCPPLDAPFAVSREREPDLYRLTKARLETAGVAWVDLAEALADRRVEELRLDRCCHYDGDGHAAIAEVLRPWLAAVAAARGAMAP